MAATASLTGCSGLREETGFPLRRSLPPGRAPGPVHCFRHVTATACVVYFWARVVHLLAYTFAIPWVRTLAFVAGFGAQATLAWQLLMR